MSIKSILIVKTSSLGDVINNLPAVSDLKTRLPDLEIDWLIEEGYTAIPAMHSGVNRVFPIAWRRWRSNAFHSRTWREIKNFRQYLQSSNYDCVLDSQGLLKSALVAAQARGPRYGYDKQSAREALASYFYRYRFNVSWEKHAVERNRQLTALALNYVLPEKLDYGISSEIGAFPWLSTKNYAVLLHGSSANRKLWGEGNWTKMGAYLADLGITSVFPWGNEGEHERSLRLVAQIPKAVVAPKLNLSEIAKLLAGATLVVGIDTGISHLSVALGRPTVGIYCATDPKANGLYGGDKVVNLGNRGNPPDISTVVSALEKLVAQ